MASDAARRLVLFGGYDGGYRNDTWVWDGVNWTLKGTAQRPSGASSALVYDFGHLQSISFGGYDGFQYSSGTWSWDGTVWTQKIPNNVPPPRAAQGMGYDAIRRQTVLFGGFATNGPGYRSDTWAWDGTNWAQEMPSNHPTPRISPSMAYDQLRGQLVLFGGDDSGGGLIYRNDTWVWPGYPISRVNNARIASNALYIDNCGSEFPAATHYAEIRNGVLMFDANPYGFACIGPPFIENLSTYYSGTSGAPFISIWTFYDGIGSLTPKAHLTVYGNGNGGFSLNPGGSSNTGAISVSTNLSAAKFAIRGPAKYNGSGTSFSVSSAPAGTYVISYGDVFGYSTPTSETRALVSGGVISFGATYALEPWPALLVSPLALTFTYQQGVAGPPQPQTITVESSNASLGFISNATATAGGNWLSVSSGTGTTPSTIVVNVAPGLGRGTYGGRISIESPGASNSPRTLPVTLAVTSPPNGGFRLTHFPLPGFTADTSDIISVFDHSMFITPDATSPYSSTTECYDGIVMSYRGEEAMDKGKNRSTKSVPSRSVNCRDKTPLYGFRMAAPFIANGNYVGDSSDGGSQYLNYDGHNGYDYATYLDGPRKTTRGPAEVVAAASGKVKLSCIPPVGGTCGTVGLLEIEHADGYITRYLHLSRYASGMLNGAMVLGGQLIGISGNTGTSGVHLHFDVRKISAAGNYLPVDPYGWCGVGLDPYTKLIPEGVNVNLWSPPSKCVSIHDRPPRE